MAEQFEEADIQRKFDAVTTYVLKLAFEDERADVPITGFLKEESGLLKDKNDVIQDVVWKFVNLQSAKEFCSWINTCFYVLRLEAIVTEIDEKPAIRISTGELNQYHTQFEAFERLRPTAKELMDKFVLPDTVRVDYTLGDGVPLIIFSWADRDKIPDDASSPDHMERLLSSPGSIAFNFRTNENEPSGIGYYGEVKILAVAKAMGIPLPKSAPPSNLVQFPGRKGPKRER